MDNRRRLLINYAQQDGYISDGLIFRFDGSNNHRLDNNISWNHYTPASSKDQNFKLQNLSRHNNQIDFNVYAGNGAKINDNNFEFDQQSGYYIEGTNILNNVLASDYQNDVTIEVVCSHNGGDMNQAEVVLIGEQSQTSRAIWFRPGSGSGAHNTLQTCTNEEGATTSNVRIDNININNIHTYTIIYQIGNSLASAVYCDAGLLTSKEVNSGYISSNNLAIGIRTSQSPTPYPFNGKIYSLRIYEKMLPVNEIGYNYQIDKIRFNF